MEEPYHEAIAAEEFWKQLPGITDSDYPLKPNVQKQWDTPICKLLLKNLMDNATSNSDRARLNAITQEHSSDWLNVIPSSNLGLKLSNPQFRISCALRLGAKICQPHICVCGKEVSIYGTHGLSCKNSAGRLPRHSAVNELIKRALCSADYSATKEPLGVSRANGKRPDGLTLFPWKNGKCLLWDYTCSDTLAPSYVEGSAKSPGYVAKEGEVRKFKHYENLVSDYIFIPISVETFGTWGESGLKFIKEVGKLIEKKTQEKRSTSFLFQAISIATQRGNALAVSGTIGENHEILEEIFYL